jgi:hypothetical protein
MTACVGEIPTGCQHRKLTRDGRRILPSLRGMPRHFPEVHTATEAQAVIRIDRSRRALATTDTELRLIAAAAIIGLSRRWLDSG